MVLLDILGRRWALRIIWELRDNALGFRELRFACGNLSPTILSRRLRELSDLKIIKKDVEGRYALSDRGGLLLKRLRPLNDWAEEWARSKS